MASFPLPFEHKRASPVAGGPMRKMVEGRRSYCVSSVFLKKIHIVMACEVTLGWSFPSFFLILPV